MYWPPHDECGLRSRWCKCRSDSHSDHGEMNQYLQPTDLRDSHSEGKVSSFLSAWGGESDCHPC